MLPVRKREIANGHAERIFKFTFRTDDFMFQLIDRGDRAKVRVASCVSADLNSGRHEVMQLRQSVDAERPARFYIVRKELTAKNVVRGNKVRKWNVILEQQRNRFVAI